MTRRSALTVLATGLIVPAAVGLFVLARTQPRGNIRPPAASARPASPTPPAVPSPSPVPSSPSAEPSPSRRSPLSREASPVPIRAPQSCAGSGDPTTGTLPGDDPRAGKAWVTVGDLHGTCDASSPVFHLRGIDTRLVFQSDAESFVVFLVDAREGLDATAGYADLECGSPCSGTQVLVNPAGDYALRVQAGEAPWRVVVQEYRAP